MVDLEQYEVSGIFRLIISSKDMREAKNKAMRMLNSSSFDGCVIEIKEVK